MKTHKIAIRNRRLRGVPLTIVQGCLYADQIELDLGEEFSEHTVNVLIYPVDESWAPMVYEYDGSPLTLPGQAYGNAGWLGLAVNTTDVDYVVITEICDHAIRVVPSKQVDRLPE